MGKVIGIDLGTTNSCVAFVDGGSSADKHHVTVIPNTEGARTTPSIVGFSTSGERLVGQVAKRQAATNPQHTVFGVKRLMGQKVQAPAVKKQLELAPYRILAAENGDAWIHAQGRDYSPPEVSAMVLAALRDTAVAFLSEPITDAVITVPAYFDDAQRQATKDAGRIAGLNVRRILNEPTAAALAYGLDRQGSERIAVFDLGGGTFDISLLEISAGVFNVKAIGGDSHLGGEDFDERLIDLFVREFFEQNGLDVRKDRTALQRLKEAAERAKHELSSTLETEINLPFLAAGAQGPLHFERTLKRSELEILTRDLVDRTITACREVLAEANVLPSSVQNVLLVGGMTRMPSVQKAVREFFGREPDKGLNPDEVVAVGAAIQGAALDGYIDEVLLLDVTPLSIGVETGGGVFTKIIGRNTTIPTEQSEDFTTSIDNQSFVPVHVLQGERDMVADNQSLARFELTGIPPAPRGVPIIRVTFKVNADGILQVEAKDTATGRAQGVQVTPTSGLSAERIDQLIAEAAEYQETDGQRRELAEIRNQAETLLYTTEQAIEGYADLLDAEVTANVRTDVQVLRQLLEGGGTLAALREAYQRLEATTFKIAEGIYGGT